MESRCKGRPNPMTLSQVWYVRSDEQNTTLAGRTTLSNSLLVESHKKYFGRCKDRLIHVSRPSVELVVTHDHATTHTRHSSIGMYSHKD